MSKGKSIPFCPENEHDWCEQSTVLPPIFKFSVCHKCWMLLIGEVMWVPVMQVHHTITYRPCYDAHPWINVDVALIEKAVARDEPIARGIEEARRQSRPDDVT